MPRSGPAVEGAFTLRRAMIVLAPAFLDLAMPAAHESRVIWYRENPEATTAKLRWCIEHQSGDKECGAAMQACGDILRSNPRATCQSPMIKR